MPKSTTIHRDPLSTNTVELGWPNANRAEPKPNQVIKTPNQWVRFYTGCLNSSSKNRVIYELQPLGMLVGVQLLRLTGKEKTNQTIEAV